MIGLTTKGEFRNLEKFLKNSSKKSQSSANELAEAIVNKLRSETPIGSSKTANSWDYSVKTNKYGWDIEIFNTNVNGNVCVAKLIHYGHGTGTGGYVPPRPFIKSAIDSVYKSKIQKILNSIVRG